jgi:hypothetical protein
VTRAVSDDRRHVDRAGLLETAEGDRKPGARGQVADRASEQVGV